MGFPRVPAASFPACCFGIWPPMGYMSPEVHDLRPSDPPPCASLCLTGKCSMSAEPMSRVPAPLMCESITVASCTGPGTGQGLKVHQARALSPPATDKLSGLGQASASLRAPVSPPEEWEQQCPPGGRVRGDGVQHELGPAHSRCSGNASSAPAKAGTLYAASYSLLDSMSLRAESLRLFD